MSRIHLHPFKEGVYSILRQHFAEPIVKRFRLELETTIYNPKEVESVWRQQKTGNLILEVRYENKDGSTEYICEVYSTESKQETEYKLLRYIRDAVKAGKIGQDWEVTKNEAN